MARYGVVGVVECVLWASVVARATGASTRCDAAGELLAEPEL